MATIDDTGLLTAKSFGTTTIKVIVGNVSATCRVTVVQPVTSIDISDYSVDLEAFDTILLTAEAYPEDAYNKEIAWSSSDPAIASVDETGMVTAHKKGTATITVTAQDGSGEYDTCTVTVTNNGTIAKKAEEMQSPHNYPINCTDFWLYKKDRATCLYVTFSDNTSVEEDFDFLYIYDGQGNEIGQYTGDSLAGQTIEVPGDTVKIKLVSDEAGTEYGFAVVRILSDGGITWSVLPTNLKEIGEEGMAGVSMPYIYLPDGVRSIGKKAFANSTSLEIIRIPSSVTQIADDAFSGVGTLEIQGTAGSAAQSYAERKGYTFTAE